MDRWALVVSAVSAGVAVISAIIAGIAVRASYHQVAAAREQAEYARRQAESARQQVSIDEQMHRDSAQPYVYVDIRPDLRSGVLLMLIVENAGPTVARNVKLTFEPQLSSVTFGEALAQAPALVNGIKSMPPGRRQEFFFDSALKRFDSDLPTSYRVTITADGPFGAVEPLEYDIELRDFIETEARGTASLKDVVKAIKGIEEQVKKVGGTLGARRLS